MYASGIGEAGVPGYIYLMAHASESSIQGIVHGALVADVVRASGIWNGQPILIDACNAGAKISGGIAAQLAFALQTYVTAPTALTWNYPFGGAAVGQGAFSALPGVLASLPFPDLTNPGQWRTWGPNGEMISVTRTSPRDRGNSLPHAAAMEVSKKR